MKAFGISNPAAQRSKKHEFWNTQPVPAVHEGVYFGFSLNIYKNTGRGRN